jgi:hypothetical protein
MDLAAAILFGSASPNSYTFRESFSLISAYIFSNSFQGIPDFILRK